MEGRQGAKRRFWGLAQGCRQIHEGEGGRVHGREGDKAKGGGVSGHDDYICIQFFSRSFSSYVIFFGCILLYILLFTNNV